MSVRHFHGISPPPATGWSPQPWQRKIALKPKQAAYGGKCEVSWCFGKQIYQWRGRERALGYWTICSALDNNECYSTISLVLKQYEANDAYCHHIHKAVIFLLVETEEVLWTFLKWTFLKRAEHHICWPNSPSLSFASFLYQPHTPKPIHL